jgi:hypothetical protein
VQQLADPIVPAVTEMKTKWRRMAVMEEEEEEKEQRHKKNADVCGVELSASRKARESERGWGEGSREESIAGELEAVRNTRGCYFRSAKFLFSSTGQDDLPVGLSVCHARAASNALANADFILRSGFPAISLLSLQVVGR